MIKAFFLDRDGVLIKNYHYNVDSNKIKWLKGAINSLKFLNKKKIKIIVITNQSGIARGYFSENQLKNFHKKMIEQLKKRKATISQIYYCPYYEKGLIKKYKKKVKIENPTMA